MTKQNSYKEFTMRLKLLMRKHPNVMITTLSNVFSMRLIGNKTHGDLAEIALSEFINQYMYDFSSIHVGKDRYRAKAQEEDIIVTNAITHEKTPISLKAYGVGPLQLSTDKNALMFLLLDSQGEKIIHGNDRINKILENKEFNEFQKVNVLPLIYDEKEKKCNILVFDFEKAKRKIEIIKKSQKIVAENTLFFNS